MVKNFTTKLIYFVRLPYPSEQVPGISSILYRASVLDVIQSRAGKPNPYGLCDFKLNFTDLKTAIGTSSKLLLISALSQLEHSPTLSKLHTSMLNVLHFLEDFRLSVALLTE